MQVAGRHRSTWLGPCRAAPEPRRPRHGRLRLRPLVAAATAAVTGCARRVKLHGDTELLTDLEDVEALRCLADFGSKQLLRQLFRSRATGHVLQKEDFVKLCQWLASFFLAHARAKIPAAYRLDLP